MKKKVIKKKRVQGYGVFVSDYGGLIGFSLDQHIAPKIK